MLVIVVVPFKLMLKELFVKLNLSPVKYMLKELKIEERVNKDAGIYFHGPKGKACAIQDFPPSCGPNL